MKRKYGIMIESDYDLIRMSKEQLDGFISLRLEKYEGEYRAVDLRLKHFDSDISFFFSSEYNAKNCFNLLKEEIKKYLKEQEE